MLWVVSLCSADLGQWLRKKELFSQRQAWKTPQKEPWRTLFLKQRIRLKHINPYQQEYRFLEEFGEGYAKQNMYLLFCFFLNGE